MFSKVLRYEVETLRRVSNCPEWVIRDTILPQYKYTQGATERRFFWWTVTTTHLLLDNERKARIKARRRAFKIAKKLHPEYVVRVFVVFKFPEVPESIRHCVWENGRYYSTH